MFNICKEHPDFDLLGTDHDSCPSDALELPILPNMFGLTSLDYCLPGKVPEDHIDFDIFFKDKDALDVLDVSENVRLGELIYEEIADYSFMHSSPFVSSSLIDAIKIGEDFADEYLEKCLKKVNHFFK